MGFQINGLVRTARCKTFLPPVQLDNLCVRKLSRARHTIDMGEGVSGGGTISGSVLPASASIVTAVSRRSWKCRWVRCLHCLVSFLDQVALYNTQFR
jgi:hypothetical protein